MKSYYLLEFGKDSRGRVVCPPRPVYGRPFIIDGNYRIPTSLVGEINSFDAKSTWRMDLMPGIPANHSLNEAIAIEFSKKGEAEHASVASFARHTLQLMTMSSPASLLVGAQEAALDEIKHAKMCYGIAEKFLGENIQPSSLDVDGSARAQSREEVIQSVINEGCIGETIAAIQAQFGYHLAKQPLVKDTLKTIAADESNHSQLAWSTIHWAIERFPDLKDIAEETFREQLDRQITSLNSFRINHCYDCEQDSALRDHGLLLDEDEASTQKLGIQNVIGPNVQNNFHNIEDISKQIISIDFSKY